MLTNYSNSTFDAAQFEVRTREKEGLTLQANYNYSKVISDAVSGNDNNNQGRYEPMIDSNNPKLERARAPFDLTHVMKFNYVYRLPIGENARINPTDLEKYTVFVQSTSVNRKLIGGTSFLYEVEDWDKKATKEALEAVGAH